MIVTLNLSIIGAFALTYYIIGVITILAVVAYQTRQYKHKTTAKNATKAILMAFVVAPVFPYLLIKDYRDHKNSQRVIAEYKARREAERREDIYA